MASTTSVSQGDSSVKNRSTAKSASSDSSKEPYTPCITTLKDELAKNPDGLKVRISDPYAQHGEFQYEFGGPVGVTSMMIGFPLLMWYLFVCYKYYDCKLALPAKDQSFIDFIKQLVHYAYEGAYPTRQAWAIEWGFLIFQAILYVYLPGGIWTEGSPFPQNGNRGLQYYCSAVQSLYFSTFVALALHFSGIFKLYTIIDRFGEIMSVAIISGFLISFFVYFRSIIEGTQVRMTGIFVYDFFMGAPLYPRIGKTLDLKMFFEVRLPWYTLYFLALAAVLKQYNDYGYVSFNLFHAFFSIWLFANACSKGEHLIIPSWDIFYEKFGFMLIFWNIAGVPFTYCYNTLYLVSHDPATYKHSTLYNTVMFVTLLVAHYFFDTTNGQKNSFRQQIAGTFKPRKAFPQLPWVTIENPTFIKCKNGGTLLADGWYRYAARKIHYTVDFIQNMTWALNCGFHSPLPYFYPAFFLGMILHRASRDEQKCAEKYGEDWEAYKKICPYRFIPGIY